ncbi:hypothetical protein HPB47_025102 [Ixodes persulcatus]|uniref:Uncharacterized protein n=1 Tax=Ixodes persulcatus TaxID=34615 RepID=A0AC60Q2G9_IXOPE|nr:hypothetical protein HPB47_025102 [Ixodes persulcatus]
MDNWSDMTAVHDWSRVNGADCDWGWVDGLDNRRGVDLNRGREGGGIGWLGGLGAWLVGLDGGAVAKGVGDVVNGAGNATSVHVAVRADFVVVHISSLLAGQAGAKLVDVVVAEAVWLRVNSLHVSGSWVDGPDNARNWMDGSKKSWGRLKGPHSSWNTVNGSNNCWNWVDGFYHRWNWVYGSQNSSD